MSARDELKEMARGFRWGRRSLVPRSAEPFAEEDYEEGFPTDWGRPPARRAGAPRGGGVLKKDAAAAI